VRWETAFSYRALCVRCSAARKPRGARLRFARLTGWVLAIQAADATGGGGNMNAGTAGCGSVGGSGDNGWCWRRWRRGGRRCWRYRGDKQHDHDGKHDGDCERGCTAEPRECCPSSHFHSGVSFSFEDQLSISCVVRRSDDPRSFLVGETAASVVLRHIGGHSTLSRSTSTASAFLATVGHTTNRNALRYGLGWREQFITTRRNLVAMKKQGVQRSASRTDLRETVIREGERLVSKESKEVNLFARLQWRMWSYRRWERRAVASYLSDNRFDALEASVALRPYAGSALKLADKLLQQQRGGRLDGGDRFDVF
jgi:hypothetical protein